MGALILFEDESAGRFEPVALTRSVARLRLGLGTHRERWGRIFPDRPASVVVRDYLVRVEEAAGGWAGVNEVPEGDALFVSAAAGRPSAETEAAVRGLDAGQAVVSRGHLLAARAAGDAARALAGALREAAGAEPFPGAGPEWPNVLEAAGFSVSDGPEDALGETLVDLIDGNAEAVHEDFALEASGSRPPDPADHPGAQLIAPERMRFGAQVRIDPGAVLDAREGPIALGAGTRVAPGCVLTGPLAAGRDCRFNPAARVSGGVSLGPATRVGGEISASIVQGYSNKQHDGFLGHSYLGCWVNLGAATDTSDLRNDYGDVTLTLAGAAVPTGRRGVGSLLGDHTKTAIHTRLNTGSVIGVCANVLAPDFPEREVPSFTWGGGASRAEYRLPKAVQVAMKVAARRGVEFGPVEEALFARIHRATAERRRLWVEGRPPR
jgi:UDP-N-acetylglucosamine diphosphorylase/glucosamine-1-phosphate N-acetyltransferase